MSFKIRVLLVSIVLLCSAIAIICNWTTGANNSRPLSKDFDDDGHDEHFDALLYSSLIFYSLMCVDAIIEYFFQKNAPKEFSWPIHLFVAAVPNVCVYCHILRPSIVPLTQYFQHTCLILLQEYRIQRLSSFQGVESQQFGKFFVFLVIACGCATFYNLSSITAYWAHYDHQLKAATLSLTLAYHVVIIKGAYDLIKLSIKDHCIIRYSATARAIFLANLTLLVSAALVPFIDVVFYDDQLILFPDSYHNNTILAGLILTSTCVTYLIRCYEHRLQFIDLEEKYLRNRKMMRAISHEIRTPLNTAFMAIDLLQDSMSNGSTSHSHSHYSFDDHKAAISVSAGKVDEWLETVDNVRDACNIALGILNQLLTYDKLSAKMLQLEQTFVPILHILEANTKFFRLQALQGGIHFSVDVSTQEKKLYRDLCVYVDEHKINQVLRNFLSNAMKFTPAHGRVKVKLRLELYRDTVSALPHTTSRAVESKDYSARAPNDGNIDDSQRSSGHLNDFFGTHYEVIAELQGQSNKSIEIIDHASARSKGSLWSTGTSSGTRSRSRSRTPKLISRDDQSWGSALWNRVWTAHNASIASRYATIAPQDHSNSGSARTRGLLSNMLSATKEIGKVMISIVDSGPGVSKDDQSKLFQEYVQINPGELQKGQGSGLGLSIAKSIVAMHGGRVGMSSEGAGCGSTFFVELPLFYRPPISGDEPSPAGSVDGHSDHGNESSHTTVSVVEIRGERDDDEDIETGPSQRYRRGHYSHDVSSKKVMLDTNSQTLTSTPIGIASVKTVRLADHGTPVPQLPDDTLNTATDAVCQDNTTAAMPGSEHVTASGDCDEVTLIGPPPSLTPAVPLTVRKQVSRNSVHAVPRKSLTVLVVDDSKANRKMMMRLLTRDGHRCFEACDGAEAVLVMKTVLGHSLDLPVSLPAIQSVTIPDSPVDVILMDYFMTTMNGPAATKLIRSMGYKRPIIGVTGSLDEEVDEFLKSGVDQILQKPVDLKSLVKAFQSRHLM